MVGLLYGKIVQLWRKYALWYALNTTKMRDKGSHSSILPQDIHRILIVCTGLIGDTIMGIPTMRAFRRLYPEARIIGLVMPHNKALLEPLGIFDEFIICEVMPYTIWPWRWPKLWSVKRQIRKERFDLALLLLGGDWAPTLYRAGIRIRIDAKHNYFAPLATHLYEIPPRLLHPNTLLNAIRSLGWQVEPEIPQLQVSERARQLITKRLLEWGIGPNDKLIIFHPFASTANRSLSPSKVKRILDLLTERNWWVGLIGSRRANLEIPQKHPKVLNLVGQLPLSETMALIERADGVLTTDSGPLHIAGALGRPTVGLFRAIRPEYASLYPSVKALFWEGGTQCLPGCTWDSWYGCREAPCRQLEFIPDETILSALQVLLQPPTETRPTLQ
jgi:heptosyltransferase-1